MHVSARSEARHILDQRDSRNSASKASMAAFDPAIEMQQIEEMDEEDLKKELAAAGERVNLSLIHI